MHQQAFKMIGMIAVAFLLTGCGGKAEKADIPTDLKQPLPKVAGTAGGEQPAKTKKEQPGAKAD